MARSPLFPLSSRPARQKTKGLWFERLMALLALLNLGWVLFDYSYVPWRDTYLKHSPQLAQWYGDRFKGIEPHRFTETYLATVAQLENQVAATGLNSAEASRLLAELQTLSVEMIDENPFEVANKSGTLERIKRLMRDRTDTNSSKQAFARFWSPDYLNQTGWTDAIGFFNARIRPLMARNYYRSIGENGQPIDRAWQIDSWFMGLFAIEFLARTLYLSRRYRGVSWLDTVIWRWYDLFLLLPFWRWLRVIPVAIRLDQAKLVELEPLNHRIVRNLIAGVAAELTEIVVLRIIDQLQEAIRQGDLVRWLLSPEVSRRYIDVNGVNEVEAIAKRLTTILVYQVLPRIKPDVEALLRHSIVAILSRSPAYAGLQRLPGVSQWSEQLTQQLVSDLSDNAYQALTASLEDEVGAELTKRLVANLGGTFRSEIQKDQSLEELRSLAIVLLDEVKINYAKRVAEEDLESLRAETKRLYEITQSRR